MRSVLALFGFTFLGLVMPLHSADTSYGPKDILWEGSKYTISCSVFDPPIKTNGAEITNRSQGFPDWFQSFRRKINYAQDFATYRSNGTASYFASPSLTEDKYKRAQAFQAATPTKLTLLYSLLAKRDEKEIVVVGYMLNQWVDAVPEEVTTIAKMYFRKEPSGDWKMHLPEADESWLRLFPTSELPQLTSLFTTTSFRKDSAGYLESAPP